MSLFPSFSWKCRRKGVLILTTSRTYYYDTFALKQRKTFVFEKTNSSSNDNENCWSFHFPQNIVQRFISNVNTIQINTHLHEITDNVPPHLWNHFENSSSHPLFWNAIDTFCWYEKYVKSLKRWKSLLYQSCFFLLKTRVNFFGCAGKTLFLTEL